MSVEPSDIEVTLSNVGDEPVTVVRPTVAPNFVKFVVTDHDGLRSPYIGPHWRLLPLSDDGFATLEPDESISTSFDIVADFGLEQGTYVVAAEYRNPEYGTHEGTRAVTFEPGEGPRSAPIELEVGS